eukprot:scaffold99423_cov28-Tisochrysis_lutea.AAC.4
MLSVAISSASEASATASSVVAGTVSESSVPMAAVKVRRTSAPRIGSPPAAEGADTAQVPKLARHGPRSVEARASAIQPSATAAPPMGGSTIGRHAGGGEAHHAPDWQRALEVIAQCDSNLLGERGKIPRRAESVQGLASRGVKPRRARSGGRQLLGSGGGSGCEAESQRSRRYHRELDAAARRAGSGSRAILESDFHLDEARRVP